MAQRCFLPFFVFSCFVTVQSVIYQLKGQQVQFDPDITGQPIEILWKHDGNKVVEFNGTAEQVYGSYKGRIVLDRHSAQLQISDLHFEDSGKYESEIYMNKNLFYNSYGLKIIEKVAKPNITCQMNSSSISNVSAVLLCFVELNQTESSLKFKWVSKGNVQHGPQLKIFLGGELDEEEYTCQVSNPASYEMTTFRAKDCHTVSDAGSSAGMIALIVCIPFVIICVGLVILFCRLKRKNSACRTKEQKIDLENPTSSEGTIKGNQKEGELKKTEQNPDGKAEIQRGLEKKTVQDEEERPLVEDQPTASSPQPQKQLDTAKGVDKKTAQDAEKRPLVEDQTTASSPPPQKQVDTKKASEEEDRGAPSNAGGGLLPAAQPRSPPTQNSPNEAPQDTTNEHNNDVNANPQGWLSYAWSWVSSVPPIWSESTSEHEADNEDDEGKKEMNYSQSALTTKTKHQEC